MSEKVKITSVNKHRKADGNPLRLGFNTRNTLYMNKIYPSEDKHLEDIFDYSKICTKGQLPCLKGCTSDTKDINLCLSMIKKRYELSKQHPNIDPKDLGISDKYYKYYMEQFAKFENEKI